MIRIAISLAAYQALAATMPEAQHGLLALEDRSRLRDSGEGVGLWVDHVTLAALRRERRGGEGWSEVILRVAADVARSPSAGVSAHP
jgi:hypothetical protein